MQATILAVGAGIAILMIGFGLYDWARSLWDAFERERDEARKAARDHENVN